MKRALALCFLLLAGCYSPAQESGAPITAAPSPAAPDPQLEADREARRMEIASRECRSFGDVAHQIMAARQAGSPMQEIMKIANDGGLPGHPALVIAAYEQPGYHTEENRARAISEFENAAYLDCVKRVAASL